MQHVAGARMVTHCCNRFLYVTDPGGGKGAMTAPQPVENSHKKDGHRVRRLIFQLSWAPLLKVFLFLSNFTAVFITHSLHELDVQIDRNRQS